jgi:hypothetical protein
MKTQHGSEHFYRLLLYLYPKKYREEYGELMLQLFRDMKKERKDEIEFWMLIGEDFFMSVISEHINAMKSFSISPMISVKLLALLNLVAGLVACFMLGKDYLPDISIYISDLFKNTGNTVWFFIIVLTAILAFTNLSFAYHLLFLKNKPSKLTIALSLLSFHLILWKFVFFFSFIAATYTFLPIIACGIVLIIGTIAFSLLKKIIISLSLITLLIFGYGLHAGFKDSYCHKKAAIVQNDINKENEQMPPQIDTITGEDIYLRDARLAYDNTLIECSKNYNFLEAAKDNYFSLPTTIEL